MLLSRLAGVLATPRSLTGPQNAWSEKKSQACMSHVA